MKRINILVHFLLFLILFFLLYLSIRTSQGVSLLEKRIAILEQKIISLSLQKPAREEPEKPHFKKGELESLSKGLRGETKALSVKMRNNLEELRHLRKGSIIIQETIASLQMDTEETIGKIDKIMEFLGIREKVPEPPEPEIKESFKKEIEKPKPVMEKKKWKELQPLQPKQE